MSRLVECRGCLVPDLCMIACPNNSVLDQLRRSACEPSNETLPGEDEKLQVTFEEPDDQDPAAT